MAGALGAVLAASLGVGALDPQALTKISAAINTTQRLAGRANIALDAIKRS
jgi:hypothetical protein